MRDTVLINRFGTLCLLSVRSPVFIILFLSAIGDVEASLYVSGSEPSFTCFGGYHDAGDADRRVYHMSNTVINLMIYEAFPDLFTDDQFNIPDKLDDEYNVLGKGNGIPDIIDEAAWGTLGISSERRCGQ